MTYHFGYWVFGGDMKKVNLENLKKNGTTDLFLNYYAFTVHGESTVAAWIEKAKGFGINVHIWMQCFYDGNWINPKTANLSLKVAEAMKYAHMKNVAGVHLDYLRYPGNAYKTSGGADAITAFVKQVKSAIPDDIVLSCAVMPEEDCKYYYGQDITALGKIVDVIIPMQYKGNYNSGSSWLTSTTKLFASKATIWSGLQSYKSDENPTKLPGLELLDDVKTCLNAGAKGAIMFRFGLVGNLNYKSLVPKEVQKENTVKDVEKVSKKITNSNIYALAKTVKTSVEKNKKLDSSYGGYTYAEIAYAFSYALNNLSSDITVPEVKACSGMTGDSMNEDVYPSDFKDQAKRIVQYIKQNGQCPNYVTTVKSQKRASAKLFIYAFARILVWYIDHSKTMPNYCTYNSAAFTSSTSSTTTTTKKKYGHATKSGCDNRGQNNSVNCGPHSIQECIRNLTGKVITQKQLASWAGTGSGGTDHAGLSTAVAMAAKQLGVNLSVEWKSFSDVGWSGIKKIINSDNQDCIIHNLYRNKWGHYEVINKDYSNYCDVQNSLGDSCSSGCYCGYVEERSHSTFQSYINGISQKSVMIITRK